MIIHSGIQAAIQQQAGSLPVFQSPGSHSVSAIIVNKLG